MLYTILTVLLYLIGTVVALLMVILIGMTILVIFQIRQADEAEVSKHKMDIRNDPDLIHELKTLEMLERKMAQPAS